MKNGGLIRYGLAAIAIVVGGIQVQAGSLDGHAIAKIFPGQFEAKVQGYRVSFSGHRNGRIQGFAYGQQDEGRWYVKGSRLCVVFKKWTKGQARCGVISQRNGWYVANGSDGEVLKFRRSDVALQ
ncbi:MAG: hypothetical protein KDK89_01935 [Alphaproteobacteria bacterium]|nr:hypothetical protein [Alphaproteobacteria bacterium]